MTLLRSALAATLLSLVSGSHAAYGAGPGWRQEKCARFTRDWEDALRRFGREDLSAAFVAGNDAFVRSGCVASRPICPTTLKDRRLADALALRVVNAGMSTTFLPFDCPARRAVRD